MSTMVCLHPKVTTHVNRSPDKLLHHSNMLVLKITMFSMYCRFVAATMFP